MPTPLLNDVISNIPFEFDNAGGNAVHVDPTNIGVSIDNAAFGTAVLAPDGVSIDVNPAVPPDDTQVANVTVTDNGVSPPVSIALDVSLTADVNVQRGHFVTTGITTRPRP